MRTTRLRPASRRGRVRWMGMGAGCRASGRGRRMRDGPLSGRARRQRPRRHRTFAWLRGPHERDGRQHPGLQRRRASRGADDDQGAPDRDLRPRPVHDRPGLLRRVDDAARNRRRLPGFVRRDHARLQLPRHLDYLPGDGRLQAALKVLRPDLAGPLDGVAAGVGIGPRERGHLRVPIERPLRLLRQRGGQPSQQRLRRQHLDVRPADQSAGNKVRHPGLRGCRLWKTVLRRLRQPAL